jgi:hypothetical protein
LQHVVQLKIVTSTLMSPYSKILWELKFISSVLNGPQHSGMQKDRIINEDITLKALGNNEGFSRVLTHKMFSIELNRKQVKLYQI